ncbi:MAG: bifunctional oligoribonuclease/PAP phosphatase NrnA [Clostridiales bacterium]|nr:bifunctional oligoribonuclease/PAP phosphatase NrnA [Clostridiales bacterium]
MEDKLKQIREGMEAAHSAAILTHVNEDPDTLASCFAMKKVLEHMGKRAVIYVSAPIEKRIRFICDDYVIYKPGTECEHDLCICIDCGDVERLGERKEILEKSPHSINIDHHRTNTNFADINFVRADASAAGEILCDIFEKLDIKLDKDIARLLFTAIASDTGSFKFSNVTAGTMRAAARLLEFDFDNAAVSRLLFDCESLENAQMEAQALFEMECFSHGRIKLVTMTRQMCEKYAIEPQDAPNLVDIPRKIEGTEIALCIKETDDGWRVNMRSNGDADVSQAALALGGGGHIKAAGATLRGVTLKEAKQMIVSLCEKAL